MYGLCSVAIFNQICSILYSGVDIPNDAYLPAGLVIIPINSALNPFLYSRLSDMIWDKTSSTREAVSRIAQGESLAE